MLNLTHQRYVYFQVSPGETVAIRYVICGSIMSVPILFNPESTQIPRKKWLVGCIAGLIGGATTFIAYQAYLYIPLLDAQTLFNVQGIFVCVIACVFLKENVGLVDLLSIVIILSGVVLVCQPSFIFGETDHVVSNRNRLIGTGLGLLCALCQGITGVLCRYLKDTKFYIFTFLLSCGGIVFSLATLPFFEGMIIPNSWEALQLVAVGLLACLSKGTLTLAFKYEDATPVTMVQSTEIVFAFFLQWAFFSTRANYLEIIGSLLVLAGICVITAKLQISKFFRNCWNKPESDREVIRTPEDEEIIA